MRLGVSYSIPITSSSTTGTRQVMFGISQVRICATADCYITIGPAPTTSLATGTLVRGTVTGECFSVAGGDQVAVISLMGGGVINVTEVEDSL